MAPFRIFVIDDNFSLSENISTDRWDHQLRRSLIELSKSLSIELWVTLTLDFSRSNPPVFTQLFPTIERKRIDDLESFLSSIDVLLLDLSGLKTNKLKGILTSDEVQKVFGAFDLPAPSNLTNQLLKNATEDRTGIAFLYQYFEQLRKCQAIFIETVHDQNEAPEDVTELIDRLCVDASPCDIMSDSGPLPWINKFWSKTADVASLVAKLKELCEDYAGGYTHLTNRGTIEFAASNDLPVLIVGESGTGKEAIAGAIHRAWIRRRNMTAKAPFVVVNCAGLSGQRAQSELFGHVAGSLREVSGHYLGAVLRACGCSNLSAGWKDEDVALRQALERVKLACEKLQPMKTSDTDAQIGSKLRNVVVEINGLFNPPNANQKWNSLPEVLRRAQKRIANAIEGNDMAGDFCDQLLLNHADQFESDSKGSVLDLRYKRDSPSGTLFLDEFGDLPAEAQALLLRFLENKTSEIQPFGYGGWIRGIKLRVIAATNDPEVASLAGIPNYPKRSHRRKSHEHSIRYDLVQRIRQIVIRAAPLTPKTTEVCLRGMFSPEVVWSGKAVKQIIEFVKINYESPIFGHRRELKRIVDLTEAHVKTGHDRGLRGFEKDVTTKLPLIRDLDASRFLTPAIEVSLQPANFLATLEPSQDKRLNEDTVKNHRKEIINKIKKEGVQMSGDFNWATLWTAAHTANKAEKVKQILLNWHRGHGDFTNGVRGKDLTPEEYQAVFKSYGRPTMASIRGMLQSKKWILPKRPKSRS